MEKLDALARIKYLVTFLNKHQDAYDKNEATISDQEWDAAYFELQKLEAAFPSLIYVNSPTQCIRYEAVTALNKVTHQFQPMLSLAKTKDISEVEDFIGANHWIAMLKMDGLTCRLTYEKGKLVRAETRGDGEVGEDVTHCARTITSIPKYIPYHETTVIDGEVICDLETFKQFHNEYSNPRNFAAGSIRLLDAKECAKRKLQFVAWDCIEGRLSGAGSLDTILRELEAECCFKVVPSLAGGNIRDSALRLKDLNNDLYHYPIDGIVYKFDDRTQYFAAGKTAHHFSGGLALKFADEEYETTLRTIEWTMGRTGVLSPVAIYDEVDIDGAKCTRASLHNVSIMEELLGPQPYVGQKIWIYRSNMIIPQVLRSIQNPVDPLQELKAPTTCPICGAATELRTSDSGTIELYCSSDSCSGKLINTLDHFAGKKGLDIKGLSKATLEKLIAWNWVDGPRSLFKLADKRDIWIKQDGFGEKSVDRILTAIEEARHPTLTQYLSALGIPLIGKTYAQQLSNVFTTYDSFRNAIAQGFDFSALDGFGVLMHEAIVNFNYYEADRIVDMKIIEIKPVEPQLEKTGNALSGATVVITGKLHHFKNRDELKTLLEAAGAKVASAVSSKTTYLINNDTASTSAKNKKAQELNIPIITENEIISMLQEE